MKNEKKEITLLVIPSETGPSGFDDLLFGHIYAKFVYLDENEEIIPHGFLETDTKTDTRYYEDLLVSCQMSSWKHETYVWQLEYEPINVQKHKAKKMYKTLNSLEQRYDRKIKKEGRPESFGQYVTTIAKLIGAKRIMFRQDTGNSNWYQFYTLPLADAQDKINQIARDIINNLQSKHEKVA